MFPAIIASISVCTILSKRPASSMPSMAIFFGPPARKSGQLTTNPLLRQAAHVSSAGRKAPGMETRINHIFCATGITYLKNSGKLEVGAADRQPTADHQTL